MLKRFIYFYGLEIENFVNLLTTGDVLKPLRYILVITMLNVVSPFWVPTKDRLQKKIQGYMTEHILNQGCSSYSSIWICKKYDTENCDEEKGTARL